MHTLDFGDADELRILQVTDFHNDADETLALETWRIVENLIALHNPHFLAVTGDIWCSDDDPENGPAAIERALDRLANCNVPWAFCWGNHDFVDDLGMRQQQIADALGACMSHGDGFGHSRVTLRTNVLEWDLFFINSGLEWNPYEDLKWFEEESIRLTKDRSETKSAIAFYHIPLLPYEEARLADAHIGIAGEDVKCWGDDGSIAKRLAAPGNIRLGLCGHSHRNDYRLEAEGITLAYGRTTGIGGYGPELDRGGTLITLRSNDEFDMMTVFPDGTTWRHGDPLSD